MSSVATRAPTGSVDLRPICDLTHEETAEIAAPLSVDVYLELLDPADVPSIQARRELLDAAFLVTLSELGVPDNDAGWDVFHARTDALYRISLIARRPVRPDADIETRLLAMLIAQHVKAS